MHTETSGLSWNCSRYTDKPNSKMELNNNECVQRERKRESRRIKKNYSILRVCMEVNRVSNGIKINTRATRIGQRGGGRSAFSNICMYARSPIHCMRVCVRIIYLSLILSFPTPFRFFFSSQCCWNWMRISTIVLLMRADDGVWKFTFIEFTRHIAAFYMYIHRFHDKSQKRQYTRRSYVFVVECPCMYVICR